ncbi:uncharacterized protein MYCFIDRAFT_212469 [Pseudocercospora fijiensis CIRAD86]|uniref:Uncharacterized protein n=1 Tax=Pseudocercospora fijiensis (strain CIRAD86) TaxID=383855 RepID=M2ZI35_PSEFD|nr:uncharacterized protein MYCFIDRAFT_212469 [Pseudocercospora fijiensis CIRAD86]EME78754.1 hypothetical protein MYCFIDRAFT_212469 [Pseudocercospora fijiensis CIRAD86]
MINCTQPGSLADTMNMWRTILSYKPLLSTRQGRSCIPTIQQQFYVDETPVRGVQIHFIDLDKRQVTKIIWEFNNAAACYAICKAGSPACPLQFNFTTGNDGPAHETANRQGLKRIE